MAILRKMDLRMRLVALFLAVALVPIIVISIMTYVSSSNSLKRQIYGQLSAINTIRDDAVDKYFNERFSDLEMLAKRDTVADALDEFDKAFVASKLSFDEFIKTGAWELVYKKIDRVLRQYKDIYGYYDLGLMDDQGNIVYTILREPDLGTNVFKGKFSNTNLSRLLKGVYEKEKADIADFEPYAPSNDAPSAFIVAVVYDSAGRKRGAVFLQLSIEAIDKLMSGEEGMGKTGETYLVGPDFLMRSDSRFEQNTILKKKIDTESVRQALQGNAGEWVIRDYRGMQVLSAYAPVEIKGIRWAMISEIDTAEAFAPVATLALRISLIAAVIATIVGILAWFVASGISVPILRIAERVSSSSQQLSSTAQELNATTEEVSSTVNQIAKGTETQAGRVEETQKVMEQMSSAVEQVSKSAASAATQAQDAAKTAQKGGEAVKEAQVKMAQISDVVISSATAVRKLSERSEEVSEIVKVITNIADQTNLLALNAAIEAARAGEYGRGFAVVAEEVRKLAEASAKSADEIEKLIKDVQKETAQAVTSIEGATKEVSVVRDIAQKLQEGLGNIIKNAETVATMAEQVSAASEQQASGATQVSRSVTDIASIAEQSASATQEASASTEEMTASMEQMAASAQELADMGVNLFELVGRKRIRSSRHNGFGGQAETKGVGRRTWDVPGQEKPSKFTKLKDQASAARKRVEGLRMRQFAKGEARVPSFDLSSAKAAHMAWKARLKAFLEGKERAMPREMITSSTDCDLGKWLSNIGMTKYKDMAEMRDLQDVHRRFHFLAGQVVNLKEKGDIPGAEARSGELETASHQIISLLDAVEGKVSV